MLKMLSKSSCVAAVALFIKLIQLPSVGDQFCSPETLCAPMQKLTNATKSSEKFSK